MSVVGSVALLLAGVLALWFGARWLVEAASRLASAMGVSALVIGLTVVAFGTSAPEIAVSTGAALEGRSDVAVGNVVGSNVFNLGVILGLVAVLSPFRVTETVLRRDALMMAAATALAAVALANLVVSRLEGAVLVVALVGYLVALALATRRAADANAATDGPIGESGDAVVGDEPPVSTGTSAADARPVRYGREGLRLVVGLALVAVGGRLLVDSAVALAVTAGVSEWLVSVTIVSAGTSVPELVTSVVATRREHVAIAAGNVVGSNVFNLLGVLGIAALVRPLVVDPAVLTGLAWLAILTAIATAALATGRRLTRLEGVGLVALAAGYWLVTAIG